MTSPTQRTIKWIKENGWTYDVVERWIKMPMGGHRKDFLGCIDIIAINKNQTIGIQSTGTAFSSHKKKILDNPNALKWIKAGNKLILIGWRKLKLKRGGKAMRWRPRLYEFTIEDFQS